MAATLAKRAEAIQFDPCASVELAPASTLDRDWSRGCVAARAEPSAADCTMCDGTGYKDYAGFAMDPCNHIRAGRLPASSEEG
ncbi:hypothetical protein [Novosphingobium sp. ST904]|nr:hypothetical protein [Novosphingobium sp. ST904]KPH59162.1 hypothetical protein ADT71_23750 [Novosphingobium sp. ST904]TCM37755.1 hypothetical protein EDF59_110151 [Novosphingobium sp. ST904]